MADPGGDQRAPKAWTRDAVKALVDSAPKRGTRSVLDDVSFTGETFEAGVSFEDVIFAGDASFADVTFEDTTSFENTTFEGCANFASASFNGKAPFDGATFKGQADFQATTWKGEAGFVNTTFGTDARSDDTRTHTSGPDVTALKGDLMPAPSCRDDVSFGGATFDVARRLGPMKAGRVMLDGADFAQRVMIVVRATSLSAVGTEFRSGTDIFAQSAAVELDSATFGAPSTLGPATEDNPPWAPLKDDYDKQTIPRVLSLRGARIADLALSNVDLRACRFRGAHGLDRLHFEQVLFAETPRGWQRRAWRIPIIWTRRLVIAEERRWQADQPGAKGWRDPTEPGMPAQRTSDSSPHQIAAIYRALRKGSEDHKDEPGGADFYYGEMEMRRKSKHTPMDHRDGASAISGDSSADADASNETSCRAPLSGDSSADTDASNENETSCRAPRLTVWAGHDDTRRRPVGEKLVLWLYWLTSGYGLRAGRALAALAVTIACFAIPLAYAGGVEGRESYWRALLHATEFSVSILRVPQIELSDTGELVTIALRLLGPLFFGLALLSLRGRVKR